jgi:hypothetical protein
MSATPRRYWAIRTHKYNIPLILGELRAQNEVRGHLKMLSKADDGVQVGHWILLPNLPEEGPFFLIAEVTGEYYFDMLSLTEDTDINDLGKDYGHVLPVRLITKDGINRYAEIVDASIRATISL